MTSTKRKYTKPPRDGCAMEQGFCGDYNCKYYPIIDCDQCIYVYEQHGIKNRGRNPQAKRNQERERR